MKEKLKLEAEKFLAEVGIRDFRRGFSPLPPVPNAVDMYVNYTWKRLENNQRTHVLEILEEAFSLELPEGYWTCTYRDELLDRFETKLAYKNKDYIPYNPYREIINHFLLIHLQLRMKVKLEPSWLPCENMRFEFKFF